MMKAILFASVLAVTIRFGFFSPTPLDSITMNLNIDDSPRGRQHGYEGYPPARDYEEDVAPEPTTTTTAPKTEQEVLKKIMQGVEDLNKLATSGKVSPQTLVGGDKCSASQIAECAGSLPEIVAKCVIEGDILKCINEVLGDQSKCKPCVCFFMELAGLPCPNTESDYEEDVAPGPTTTTTAPTTEQEVLEKIRQGVEDLNELATSGKVSPQTLIGGNGCSYFQIVECAVSLPEIVAKCVIQIGTEGDIAAILKCINEILGDKSKCKPCVCYFLNLAGIPCPNTESGQEEDDEDDEEDYIGCFENFLTPKIYENQTIILELTNSRNECNKECQEKYKLTRFIGLETGYLCRCGLARPPLKNVRHHKVADSKCQINRCPGNSDERCGAHGHIKVFEIR